ncbi:MAG: AMP-binding protein, partial [Vibrio sp.]
MNPIIPGPISSFSDLQTIEQTPIESRNLPETSYHLLVNSAKQFGDKIALRFLPQASLDETSITFSYHQLLEKVHQTANAFYQLGIAKDDVVSMLLPNLPQTHFTLWGGEAAGIINPVNPLLEVEHIVSIVDETRSQVL